MNTLPMPKNPAWHFYPETGEVKHIRSGVIALTFTMNKRRLAKITTSSGTEVLVEVPAALPPGLLPIPKYPEYGFSQAEGKVYRVQGGWATFIPRALVPHRKKSCADYYVWLIPSKGMGDKRQVSLARIAKAIAEQQGLSYAWLRLNLPGGNHSGHPVASDPEPTGAQHGASQHGTLDADLQHPDTTVCPRPKFLMDRDDARLRLPLLGGWYWWRASEMSRATRIYVTDGGKQAFTQDGWPSVPFDMGGEWGYRAPDPTEPKPAPCDAPEGSEGDLHPVTGNMEQETGNPTPEPEVLTGNPIPEPVTNPFDLYPEGDPRWTEGEPDTIEAPTPKPDTTQVTQVVRAPDVPVAPAPAFQPRIF